MDDPDAHLDALLPMTACSAVRRDLDAFVDGELDVGAREAGSAAAPMIAAHLAECPACQRLAHQLQAQRVRLGQWAARAATRADERASDALRTRVARLLAG